MQFSNPIWLAGLGGILVPLAIHLLSRKEGKIIRVGSIRHFEETSTRQFKSIKLNEILLLALRSLLILFIVFLLAGLQWPGETSGKSNWLLVEKGFEHDDEVSTIIQGFTGWGFEKRAFAKGFPIAGDSIKEAPDNYWALIESLRKQQLDSVVIISASRSNAFRGEHKTLPSNILWINRPLPKTENTIQQIRISPDSVWIRKGSFSSSKTEFTNQVVSSNTNGTSPDTIHVAVVTDKAFEYDAKLLLASLRAIDRYVPHRISIAQVDRASLQGKKQINWLFWLSDETTPASKSNVISLRPRPSQYMIEPTAATSWIITERLTPENIVDGNLTSQLTQLLFPEKESWNKSNDLDVRMSDSRLTESNTSSSQQAVATAYHGQTLWIMLIILTFITERIVSYKRMQ